MSFTHSKVRTALGITAAALVGFLAIGVATPATADTPIVNRVSGDAFGLRADGTVVAVPLNVPPTPNASLNQTRGDSDVSAADFDQLTGLAVPGLEAASLLTVTTIGLTGIGGFSHSSADVANLLGLVDAQAVHVECTATPNGFTGMTDIVGLGIAGAGVVPSGTITPPANTVIAIPGLNVTVTLNEIIDNSPSLEHSPERTVTSGHVNGIHIASAGPLGTFDIIVGHAHCNTDNRAAVAS